MEGPGRAKLKPEDQWSCKRSCISTKQTKPRKSKVKQDIDLQYSLSFTELVVCIYKFSYILRGTRNLSFVLRRSLLRTFETIWIIVITLEFSNITASKSIRRERKMRPMELSGVNFSTHGSESECSCFDQVLCIRV